MNKAIRTATSSHPDNSVFRAINALVQPKLKYRLSLADWGNATPEQRRDMDAWCVENNRELVIDASDLGEMNDHVRDMDVWDKDLLEKDPDDINEVLVRQSGGSV